MSKFFIKRPIVAIVISILMVIVGAITIVGLPVGQFPDIAPPEVRVYAMYPGADAETMERAGRHADRAADQRRRQHGLHVLAELDGQLEHGVDGRLQARDRPEHRPDPDPVAPAARERPAAARDVNQIGIDVKKALTSPMMLIALSSPKGTL